MLVFRHEGDLEFDVSVFNLSHCDTEYAEYLQEEQEPHTVEETSKNFEFKEAATHKPFGQSQFICTVKQYCLKKGYLRIPSKFAKANGLTNKECGLIIRDERQRLWNLRIYTSCSHVYIGGRWVEFRAANGIKRGDQIMFEVVTNGEQPIWKFHKAAPQNRSGQSQFVCTVKQYFLTNGYLCIPSKFAKANGLNNKKCGLIIRDERQRSWNLRIYTSCSLVFIGGRWGKFCAANDIKAGDQIMFEVVTNGKQPIWKFHHITNPSTVEETSENSEFKEKLSSNIKLSDKTSFLAEATTDKPFVQSQFECTITQYCLSRGILFLPQQFALANGLTNKKCGLIVRDERQRSWNLKLSFGSTRSRAYIVRDGWRKFAAENYLKKGDRIMFEILTSGETPIWKFRVVTDGETPMRKFHEDITKKPSNMSPPNARVSTSTSGDDDHPYKPYCVRKPILSNGLMDRKCEMILKDEANRCWSMWLGRSSHHFGIINGWTKFREANGLQVGDAYKFELIKNGKIPMAQFHCKFSGKVAKRVGD